MEKIKLKKVLILGSTGMLGHVVYSTLNKVPTFKLMDISFKDKLNPSTIICDVTNTKKLETIFSTKKPDIIINCIGVLIQGTLKSIERAIFLNAYFPHWLKNICDGMNCKLIHISTDCVFRGTKGKYSEKSIPDAIDPYGRTKALGEFDLQNHLCIRTSIIGPELKQNGEGLLHWLFKQKGNVYGYKNVFWSGVTTLQLSKAIVFAIENEIDGLWNLTNGKEISKYELIENIIKTFNLNKIRLLENQVNISNKSLTSERSIAYLVPSYEKMNDELKSFYQKNIKLYT